MGMSNKPEDFELCARLENIHLAKGSFFGLSAATGGLAGQLFINKLKQCTCRRFLKNCLCFNSLSVRQSRITCMN